MRALVASGERNQFLPIPHSAFKVNVIFCVMAAFHPILAKHSKHFSLQNALCGLNGNATDPSRRTVPRSRARVPLLIRARPFFRFYSAYLLDFPVLWGLAW